jgi:hypothetical protein
LGAVTLVTGTQLSHGKMPDLLPDTQSHISTWDFDGVVLKKGLLAVSVLRPLHHGLVKVKVKVGKPVSQLVLCGVSTAQGPQSYCDSHVHIKRCGTIPWQ